MDHLAEQDSGTVRSGTSQAGLASVASLGLNTRVRAPSAAARADPARSRSWPRRRRPRRERLFGHQQRQRVADAAEEGGAEKGRAAAPAGKTAIPAFDRRPGRQDDAGGLPIARPSATPASTRQASGARKSATSATPGGGRRRTAAARRRSTTARRRAPRARPARAGVRPRPKGCGWPSPRSAPAAARAALLPARFSSRLGMFERGQRRGGLGQQRAGGGRGPGRQEGGQGHAGQAPRHAGGVQREPEPERRRPGRASRVDAPSVESDHGGRRRRPRRTARRRGSPADRRSPGSASSSMSSTTARAATNTFRPAGRAPPNTARMPRVKAMPVTVAADQPARRRPAVEREIDRRRRERCRRWRTGPAATAARRSVNAPAVISRRISSPTSRKKTVEQALGAPVADAQRQRAAGVGPMPNRASTRRW